MEKFKHYFFHTAKNDTFMFVSLLLVFFSSSLILFFPLQNIILAFLGFILLALFFYKPEYAFYGFVLTVPLLKPNLNYLHFQDVFLFFCFISLLTNLAIRRYKPVKISTKLDLWILIISLLFIIKGFSSVEFARGSLHAVRFLEAVALYYMIVYFVRAKKIKIVTIIKLLIITTVFQGLLGTLQSLTNSFGVQDYANDRGYFGYLGLGPKLVYSGRGTFWHFAAYGYFLGSIILFLLPFYRHIIKNKKVFNIFLFCIFAGIVFSYSRGAMAALIVGIIYYLVIVERKKTTLMLKLLFIAMIITPLALYFLTNQEYIMSLNPRNLLWGFHITYLLENPSELIWGAGFESRESTFYLYAPKYLRHPGDYNPHNLILTYIEEIGIIGLFLYLSFWLKVFIDTFKLLKHNSKLMKSFYIGLQLVLFIVFISGINDHVYHDPYLTMFLMLLLGIGYAKVPKTGQRSSV